VQIDPTFATKATATPVARLLPWLPSLQDAADRYEINTRERLAAWLANIGIESAAFTATEEGMYYTSASRIRMVWPHLFASDADALPYSSNPRRLANRVYANRLGNGNEASGDGWTYRGMGLIQLTGKSLQLEYLVEVGASDPSSLKSAPHAALSAGWYWHTRGCNVLADARQWYKVRQAINGPAALKASDVTALILRALT